MTSIRMTMDDESKLSEDGQSEEVKRIAEALASEEGGRSTSLEELLVLSEQAYLAKAFHLAVKAMRFAVELRPGEASIRFRLGVCLHLDGDLIAAENEFRQTIFCDQKNEGAYQSLIQVLIARDDLNSAIAICVEQARHCGNSEALSKQLVTLLIMAERAPDALELLQRINSNSPQPVIENLRLEAELSFRAGLTEQAIQAAHKAYLAHPGDIDSFLILSKYLCADRRFAMAIPLLLGALQCDPSHVEARSLLSTSFAETGNYKEALRAAIPLVQLDPQTARHWLFAATLADMLGYHSHAIELLYRAAEIAPHDSDIHIALSNLLGRAGHFDEAIAILDWAQTVDPSNKALRDTRIHYLTEKQVHILPVESSSSSLILPLPKLSAEQRQRWSSAHNMDLQGFWDALRIKVRVVTGLAMRELSHRAAQSKLGIASNLIEPILQIIMLGVVLTLFNQGRPPLGDKLFFFYATGVLPFYLFLHVITYSLNIYTDNQALLQIPIISRLDIIIAVALTEFLIGATTTVAIFTGFHLFDMAPHSDNVIQAVFAYGVTFLIALGFALIFAILNNLTKMVEHSWHTVQRVLYFASGIFFLPQNMPVWVREPLSWNPLLQTIEWFRTGFFPQYDPPWLNRGYLITVALGLIVVGAMLQRALRHRVKTV